MAKTPKATAKTKAKRKAPAKQQPVTAATSPAPAGAPEEDPEQQQAIAAVSEAATPAAKQVSKIKKDQEIEVRLKLPGMVPIVTRRVRYADLRNGALSDQLVREMLEELAKQF